MIRSQRHSAAYAVVRQTSAESVQSVIRYTTTGWFLWSVGDDPVAPFRQNDPILLQVWAHSNFTSSGDKCTRELKQSSVLDNLHFKCIDNPDAHDHSIFSRSLIYCEPHCNWSQRNPDRKSNSSVLMHCRSLNPLTLWEPRTNWRHGNTASLRTSCSLLLWKQPRDLEEPTGPCSFWVHYRQIPSCWKLTNATATRKLTPGHARVWTVSLVYWLNALL